VLIFPATTLIVAGDGASVPQLRMMLYMPSHIFHLTPVSCFGLTEFVDANVIRV
jgi:hypothetical protein